MSRRGAVVLTHEELAALVALLGEVVAEVGWELNDVERAVYDRLRGALAQRDVAQTRRARLAMQEQLVQRGPLDEERNPPEE